MSKRLSIAERARRIALGKNKRASLTPEQQADAAFWLAEKAKWADVPLSKQRYRWEFEDLTPLPQPKRTERLPGEKGLVKISVGRPKLPALFDYNPTLAARWHLEGLWPRATKMPVWPLRLR